MTYIWNRVDRVPKDIKSEVLVESFRRWAKERYKILSKVTDNKKKKQLLNTISKQTSSYQDALGSHKHKAKQ